MLDQPHKQSHYVVKPASI